MEREKIKRIIEAMIFSTDKSLPVHNIKEVLIDVESQDINSLILELKQEYMDQNRSFRIIEVAGGYCMITDGEYAPWLRKLYKQDRPDRLSSSALETLAVIAYRQPVTRAEIEFIRGVNIDGVLRTLLDRGLVKVRGRKQTIGRPFVYGTTREFLECFGLNSLSDLPKLKDRDIQSIEINMPEAEALKEDK